MEQHPPHRTPHNRVFKRAIPVIPDHNEIIVSFVSLFYDLFDRIPHFYDNVISNIRFIPGTGLCVFNKLIQFIDDGCVISFSSDQNIPCLVQVACLNFLP